jgi:hypothetical protein
MSCNNNKTFITNVDSTINKVDSNKVDSNKVDSIKIDTTNIKK